MSSLPTGTLTLLFTDIEGSTSLLRELRGAYGQALADHARILRAAADRHGGREIDTQGDAFFFVFRRAADGLGAAVGAQRELSAHRFPNGASVRVRMGLHTGEPELDGERYVGLAVHHGARICSAAHGGQIVLSHVTAGLVEEDLPAGVSLRPLGGVALKDFPAPQALYDVAVHGLEQRFPAPRASADERFADLRDVPSSAGVEVLLLGPVEVRRDGRPLTVTAARHRQILAVLGLAGGDAVSSDRLVDALWGERPPATASKTLQVYVSELRKLLGSDRASVIASQPPGYRLALGRDRVDLYRFERLWQEGREALERGDAGDADRTLGAALELWRGAPLADFTYERAFETEIARLEEMRAGCAEDRFDAQLALGRHAAAAPALATHVREHPLRERAVGQLMLALYRCGRQADALETYQRARETLVDQLGIDPSPALVTLERQILQQDPALGAPVERHVTPTVRPSRTRTVLVVSQGSADVEPLLHVALPLARAGGADEVIVARVVTPLPGADAGGRLREVAQRLGALRRSLAQGGDDVRVAAFTSTTPGADVVKLAVQQEADLLLLDGSRTLLEARSGIADELLDRAPPDVALVIPRDDSSEGGDVVCPFAGGEHDWAALELAAAYAEATGSALTLAGAAAGEPHEPDASRLLANASIAIQRSSGIVAAPLLVPRGADGIVRATGDAALVVCGLSPRFRSEGIGETRLAIAQNAAVSSVFVRRGTRPGILAPAASLTRFSWSLSRPAG